MTNTRITDPEILERRFPVILRQFILRQGSGGAGKYRGGDGVIRELEFRRPLVVSILSERRSFQPYGLEGGEPGLRGLNHLQFTREGRLVNLGGKNTVQVFISRDRQGPIVPFPFPTLIIYSLCVCLCWGQVTKGDVLIIHTPGGGGFGAVTDDGGHGNKKGHGYKEEEEEIQSRKKQRVHTGSKGGGTLHQYTLNQESA